MDERLRLVAELQNKASGELRRLTKDMGAVKPNSGMVAAHRWMTDFRAAGQKAAEATRPLSGALSALGVGGIAAGLSLGEMVKQFRDLAAEIPKLKELGRESGISETEIKRLAYAARMLNADGDKMGAAIGTWSGKMVEFRKHTGTLYTEMLRQNSDLAKKIQAESPAEGFKDMLGWIARIPDAAKKAGYSAADAVQIQKRYLEEATGGDDLMPMLAKGAQGLADAYGEATKNVAPITPELERQAEALNQSLARFDQTWANFKQEVGPAVLNGLSETVDKLDRVFKLVQAHPVETGIAAGGAAALYARNRIMRGSQTFGLRDAATKHLEAAAALKGAAASLAGKGCPGTPGGAPGGNDKGVPSLGSRVMGFGLGLAGIVANAPSADASGDEERQANHNAIESLGQTIENALHLPQMRERIYGSAKLRGEDDREGRARASDMLPTSSTAKKDTADAIKAGTLAAWREISQQQDLSGQASGGGGVGAPSLRYGRGADGQFRRGGHSGGGRNYPDTPDGAGHAGDVKGGMGMRAMAAMKYLVEKKGWTPAGAAEAVGNAMQESQVSSRGGVGDPNVPGGSHKMFQWNNGRNNDTVNGRWARFQAFAKAQGKTVDDFEANLDFMDEERKHRSGLESQWHKQTDLRNAGRLSHLYEGYGDNSEGTRVQNARNMLDLWKKQHPGAYADGGVVSGSGGPRSDSIWARVSSGEFVVNAKQAERHLGLLHAINDGRAPAFADGGRVGSWLSFFSRPQRDGGMGARRGLARAAVAMMQGESGRAMNPNLYGWDVNGPSGGTAQWHDVTKGRNAGKVHRLSDLMAFAMMQHADWKDVGVQQAWWKHEALGPLRGAWKAMAGARTAAGALRAGINRFEVPADKQGEFMKRLPNLVRLARQDAGGSATVAEQRRMEGELHVHVHEGRAAKVVAKNGSGLRMHIRSNPTMVTASR